MHFNLLALVTAGLAAVSTAYTHPRGPVPKGNPIRTPGLNQIVHKGEPFEIKWTPTTQGTVTLLLLRGPSTNIHVLRPIAQKIPNNGHHRWIPGNDLEVDDTHYGLQLIVDNPPHKGQYQYSTQFGIGPRRHHGLDSESERVNGLSLDKSSPQYTTSEEVVSTYTTYCSEATSVTMGTNTYTVTTATSLTITDCPCTITHSYTAPSSPVPTTTPSYTSTHSYVYPTTTPHGNGTTPYYPHGNGTMTHSTSSHQSTSKHVSSHLTTTTSPAGTSPAGTTMHAPTSTPGAAGRIAGSAGVAGVVGALIVGLGL